MTKKELKQQNIQELKEAGLNDYLIQNYHYTKIQGLYVEVYKKKPPIDRVIFYDDKYERPKVDFELFKAYNFRLNAQGLTDEEIEKLGANSTIVIAYEENGKFYLNAFSCEHYLKEFYTLQGANIYTLTQAEKAQVVRELKALQADYTKRLETYWKKYSNKVYAYGYWADR